MGSSDFLKDSFDFLKDSIDFLNDFAHFLKDFHYIFKDSVEYTYIYVCMYIYIGNIEEHRKDL